MFRLNMCEKIVDKKYICTQLSQTCEPMKSTAFNSISIICEHDDM